MSTKEETTTLNNLVFALKEGGQYFNSKFNNKWQTMGAGNDHGKIFENRVKILLSLYSRKDEDANEDTRMSDFDMFPERDTNDKWDVDPERYGINKNTGNVDDANKEKTDQEIKDLIGTGINIKLQKGDCKGTDGCTLVPYAGFDLADAHKFWEACSQSNRWYFLTGIYRSSDVNKGPQFINIIEMGKEYYEFLWGRNLEDDIRDDFGSELKQANDLIKSIGREPNLLYRVFLYYGTLGTTIDYFFKSDKRKNSLKKALENKAFLRFAEDDEQDAIWAWVIKNTNFAGGALPNDERMKKFVGDILKEKKKEDAFLQHGFCSSGILRQLNFLLGDEGSSGTPEHKSSGISISAKFTVKQFRIQANISKKKYEALFKRAKEEKKAITIAKGKYPGLSYLFEPVTHTPGSNPKAVNTTTTKDYVMRGGSRNMMLGDDEHEAEADFLLGEVKEDSDIYKKGVEAWLGILNDFNKYIPVQLEKYKKKQQQQQVSPPRSFGKVAKNLYTEIRGKKESLSPVRVRTSGFEPKVTTPSTLLRKEKTSKSKTSLGKGASEAVFSPNLASLHPVPMDIPGGGRRKKRTKRKNRRKKKKRTRRKKRK